MGNLNSNANDSLQDVNSNLKINLDFKKQIVPQLKQLLSWSLAEIRQIYAPFRKRKSSPLLTRSQFLRFLRMSRMTSFYIYDQICKNLQPISTFQIMAVLVMTSYTTTPYKVQFLVNVFDFIGAKTLQFAELILMFKSVLRGYSFLTDQAPPSNSLMQKYAQIMFSRADLNNDQNLQLAQIMAWFQNRDEAKQLFDRFQPKIYGKEQYYIFNSFAPYSQKQRQVLFNRLNKFYKRQKLSDSDYCLLKPIKRKHCSNNIVIDENIDDAIKQNKPISLSKQISINLKDNQLSKLIKSPQKNIYRKNILKQFNRQSHSIHQGTIMHRSTLQSPFKKKSKKFENIIIIKGKTITKKQVYDLRQYFDKISGGKKIMFIQDFIDSFSQQKYSHMKSVAASLYNFLDKNQSGKVTFFDLILKLYPNLTSKHLDSVKNWCNDYNRNFNLEKKIKATRAHQDSKKRILPKSCLPRFKQIFQLFDKQNKGYLTYQNLQKILGQVCTDKQLGQLFEQSDIDKDGKLTMQQFAHVLLPPDLDIEGLQ